MDDGRRIVLVTTNAIDVRQKNQLFRPERLSNGHRRGIGIDVEMLPHRPLAHRRDHGDLVGVRQPFNHIAIDPGHMSDSTEVLAVGRRQFFSKQHIGRLKGKVDRASTERFNFLRQLAVEVASQNALDNFKRLRIGHSPAADELCGDPGLLERLVDRLSAAMDHDGPHSDGFHENDVQQDVSPRVFILQKASTELDDGRLPAKLADPSHRFDEGIGFGNGLLHADQILTVWAVFWAGKTDHCRVVTRLVSINDAEMQELENLMKNDDLGIERLALIGGGKMGRALIDGITSAGVVAESSIVVVEPDSGARQWWTKHHPQCPVVDSIAESIAGAEVVLLAVKPDVVPSAIGQGGDRWPGRLLLSVAAGVTLQQLSSWLCSTRVARVMPNTPCLVGAGATAYCFADGVTAVDRRRTSGLLSAVGIAVEVAEKQMDAVTGLSGSGPAYVCVIIEALADGGVAAGLPRDLAMRLATQTVLGTARMVAETNRHPAELKDAVASPGGTTIAGLRALEQNGLRSALIEAVVAAAQRSRELC